jgi:hypothetical protein
MEVIFILSLRSAATAGNPDGVGFLCHKGDVLMNWTK